LKFCQKQNFIIVWKQRHPCRKASGLSDKRSDEYIKSLFPFMERGKNQRRKRMKKASKLLLALLVVLLAGVLMGCSEGDEGETGGYKNPTESSTTLKTYYIKAVDSTREAPWNDLGAVNRMHFHAPKGTAFKIQKIFTSNSMTDGVPAGAAVWYDFTKGNNAGDYETGNYGGTLAAGEVAGGVWTLDNSAGIGEVYPGNLGIALDNNAYFGFVMANVSETATFDNLQFEFRVTGDAVVDSKPAAYFFGFTNQPGPDPGGEEGDLNLTEWTPAYIDTTDSSINTIIFHVNAGFVEIQKVFVNSTKSMDGAFPVLDFTMADPNVNVYWSNITGEAVDTGTADGRFVIDKTEGYTRWDAFGSPAAFDNSAPVWIFVIRTTSEDKTGLGDARVQFGPDGTPPPPVVNFNAMDY
jgi:hypothetical protein